MSKIIKFTPELINEIKAEFEKALQSSRFVNGQFTFSKQFTNTGKKASLCFTPEAYAKMTALVQAFDKEVAWHFVTERGENENEYIIYDVMVYPQTVTAATVDMDVDGYGKWLEAGLRANDERFFHMHGQGHSHVNMGVSPSSTDMDHQRKTLADLRQNGFYVFVIWNKRNEHNIWIYDLDKNTVFENADITVHIGNSDFSGFIKEAKELVRTQTYVTPVQNRWNGGYDHLGASVKPAAVTPVSTPVKKEPETKQEKKNDGKKEKVRANASNAAPVYPYSLYDDDDLDDPTDPFYVKDYNYYGWR